MQFSSSYSFGAWQQPLWLFFAVNNLVLLIFIHHHHYLFTGKPSDPRDSQFKCLLNSHGWAIITEMPDFVELVSWKDPECLHFLFRGASIQHFSRWLVLDQWLGPASQIPGRGRGAFAESILVKILTFFVCIILCCLEPRGSIQKNQCSCFYI